MASSSTIPAFEYDVFISFRGEDTRKSFTSHLHTALQHKGIKTYKDDEDLERGDEISQALKKAIEMSKLYVIIFSTNYASSSWCLDELVHILECRENYEQTVLPVFYGIDPSDVRGQRGSYRSAFGIHEERFRNEMNKVQKWRDALTAAANLAGWDSQVIRDESDLVERIIEVILRKMNHTRSSANFKGLVGITKRISQIESSMCTSSLDNVRKLGIWGSGGIGKTTLARVVFDQISYEFESCCFLDNIREEWGKGNKHNLKEKLFSDLLREKDPNIGTLSVGPTYDKDRLCSKKVLIIFDDSEQLEFLVEDYSWFGPGSRIIITTRDMEVLREEADEIHKVERLNNEEALQLFQSNAFKGTPLAKELLHLSERVINYSEGIPLALTVFGSFLRGKKHENWEEELIKLKECPHPKVQSILRISFDGLDQLQQCIFLDIACFFKGLRRDYAERMLYACRSFAKSIIDNLVDRSLISIKEDNILWMHDLIQEMGWEIEQSNKELPRRSRLWNAEDVYRILKTDIGSETIEGIVLDTWKISEVHPAAFKNMYKLRLLKIVHSKNCEVCIPSGDDDLQFLPDSLRYLHWDGYPWKSFPLGFRPEDLVELILPYSKVKKLWKGSQHLGSLKKIDISYSEHLTAFPDLSGASKLEHVYLEYCTSLQEVPSYFEHLDGLKTLFLVGCSSIHKFPRVAKSIVCLALSGTSIHEVPASSIEHLCCLEILSLDFCRNVKSLPHHISKMKSLKAVTFEGTLLISKYYHDIFPWWIEKVFTLSQLSTYRHEFEGDFRFFLRPLLKLECVPKLPLVGFYRGIDMYVHLVSILERFGDLNLDHDQGTMPDSDKEQHGQNPIDVCREINSSVRRKEFLLFNCLQLYGKRVHDNKLMSARLLKFLYRKIALQEFTSHGLPIEADIGVCCTGVQVPKWFRYRFSEPSVPRTIVDYNFEPSASYKTWSFWRRRDPRTRPSAYVKRAVIDLPPNSLNSNFLGFAVCASITTSGVQQSSLLCKPHFIMSNGVKLTWDLNYYCTYLETRVLEEDWLIVREKITKVVFEFSLYPENTAHRHHWRLNECGIHLLYEEDAYKFGVLIPENWKELEEEEEEEDNEEAANRVSVIYQEDWKALMEEEEAATRVSAIYQDLKALREEDDDDDDDDEFVEDASRIFVGNQEDWRKKKKKKKNMRKMQTKLVYLVRRFGNFAIKIFRQQNKKKKENKKRTRRTRSIMN